MTERAAPRTDWTLVGLLFLAGLFAAGQFAKLSVSLSALPAAFPERGLPFTVSALSIAGLVFGVTAGVVIARLGARRVLLAGLLAGAGFSAIEALLPPFPLFLALRVLEGCAHLSIVVAAPTIMASVAAPRDVPVTMGLWGMFFSVGYAMTAAAAPVLATPPALFLTHGAGMALIALILAPRLPQVIGAHASTEGFAALHRATYGSLRIFAPALFFFWHPAIFLGLLTYLPGFVGHWTAPLLPLSALVGTFSAGLLARRIAPPRIVTAGLALTAALMLLLPLLPAPLTAPVLLALFPVAGLVAGASFASVPWLLPEPADRARANGAIAQMGNLGTFISTPAAAMTLHWGLAGPTVGAAVTSILGLIVVQAIVWRLGLN